MLWLLFGRNRFVTLHPTRKYKDARANVSLLFAKITIPCFKFLWKQIQMKGSITYEVEDYKEVIEMMATGK
jgi:D-arabinose 1-dehydrogenase-like Zn-dependent alcohol dehydrogenase